MKKILIFLLVSTLCTGLFSCKKTSDQQASTPIVTINADSTVPLNGLSGALLLNGGDSLVIGFTNTTSTDTAKVINQVSGDSSTNYNYFYINLAAKSPIVAGMTYSSSSSNTSSLHFGLQNNGLLYLPYIPSTVVNSVTINSVNSTSVSGVYTATLYKVTNRNPFGTDGTAIKITGSFSEKFLL